MKKILSIQLIFSIAFLTLATISPEANAHEPPEQLTTNPYKDFTPSWSPDGTKIAYTAFSDSWYRHIWIMNSDGSGKTQLTFGNIVDEAPVFSPDGTKILFQRWGFRGDRIDLMLMNADGTGIIRLTDAGLPGMVEGTYDEPRWSHDGSKLVFSYGEGITAQGHYMPWWVCTVDFVAGDIDEGDINPIVRGLHPLFCYDDTKILFTHSIDPYLGDMQIAMINADGTGDIDYLSNGPTDYQPDMSPLTKQIVFTRGMEVGDLYLMDADASNLNLLLSNGERNYMASWSPTGEYIAYTSGIIDVDYDIWKIHVQCAPVGSFTYQPPAPYVGDTVIFNASTSYDPDGTVVGYYWDFGEGHNETGMIVNHAYSVEGTFTTTLTLTDNDGLTKTTTADITVIYRVLSIKLSGEHDYLVREPVTIRLAALVSDAETMEPVSGANLTMEIYDPEGNLWISDNMKEKLLGKGVYEWQSTKTIRQLMQNFQLRKGVYLVLVQASYNGGPIATDIIEFHIDPPQEQAIELETILLVTMIGAIGIIASVWYIDHRRLSRKLYKL